VNSRSENKYNKNTNDDSLYKRNRKINVEQQPVEQVDVFTYPGALITKDMQRIVDGELGNHVPPVVGRLGKIWRDKTCQLYKAQLYKFSCMRQNAGF